MTYLNHPYADLFPMASKSDFGSLTHSIGKVGLIEPIVIYQDMILDGRNRFDACTNAKVKPHYTFFEGDDAAALNYVLAKNLSRRHLTTSQRAIVAAKIADMKVGGNGSNQHKSNSAKLQSSTSQSDAADKLNVSTRSVASAAKVIESGDDELIAAVESGEVTVSRAAEVVELPKEERPKALSERAKAKGARVNVASSVKHDDVKRLDINPELAAELLATRKENEALRSQLFKLKGQIDAEVEKRVSAYINETLDKDTRNAIKLAKTERLRAHKAYPLTTAEFNVIMFAAHPDQKNNEDAHVKAAQLLNEKRQLLVKPDPFNGPTRILEPQPMPTAKQFGQILAERKAKEARDKAIKKAARTAKAPAS